MMELERFTSLSPERAKRLADEKAREHIVRTAPLSSLPPIPPDETNVMPVEDAVVREKYNNISIVPGLCSIIILTFERFDLLTKAIKSLRENTAMPLELIVLEGGSSKDVQKRVYEYVANSEPFHSKQLIMSIGDCHSNVMINRGYAAARGEYVFLANDDIEVTSKYWAERLIQHGKNLNNVGIIGTASNATYVRQIIPPPYDCEEHIGEYDISDQIAGCLVYIPRRTWQIVGEYDENLSPRCGADADYSIRCRAHGLNLYFAKDVYIHHGAYTTQEKWQAAYPYNQKKYGVDFITYEVGKHCVQRAKEIYGVGVEVKPQIANTDAVGIWFYRGTIIEKTIDSLVKYTPKDIPIYIMEQSAPEMKAERVRLQKAVDKYADRIQIHRCFISRSRMDAPKSIIKFLEDHPEIQHLLKIDDDFIVCSDIYTALKEAYKSRPNTLWSQAICPLNIVNLDILKKRVPDCEWFPPEMLNPETMYNWLKKDNKRNMQIWQSTTPPSKILLLLRAGERFVLEPNCKRDISAGHYYAHRSDILKVGGTWDEPGWTKLAEQTKRPRVLDSWNIAYHLSWYPAMNYSLKHIVPELIDKMEF